MAQILISPSLERDGPDGPVYVQFDAAVEVVSTGNSFDYEVCIVDHDWKRSAPLDPTDEFYRAAWAEVRREHMDDLAHAQEQARIDEGSRQWGAWNAAE